MDDQGQEQQLRIKISVCNKWRNIGHLLKIDKSILQAWATMYHDNPLECIELVMSHWLENPTKEYPVSWEGLKELLKDVELCETVNKLKKALKSEDEPTMS